MQSFLAYRAAALFTNVHVKRVYLTVIGIAILTGVAAPILYSQSLPHLTARSPFLPPIALALSRSSRPRLLRTALASFQIRTGNNAAYPMYATALSLTLFSAAAVDVVITATLVVLLRKKILNFHYGSDSMIRALIRLAIISASCECPLARSWRNVGDRRG